jgi:penicillin amidase
MTPGVITRRVFGRCGGARRADSFGAMKLANHLSKYVLGVALASVVLGACTDDNAASSSGTPPVSSFEAGFPDTGTPDGSPVVAGVDVHIPGLSAPVRAVYDEYGFLHISGKTDEDAFAALGYFHAANRFFFMDFLRNAIRGTLGKLISAPGVVDNDITSRTFFATPQGDPLPEKLVTQFDPVTKAAFDSYARGVNAWLADMRAKRNGATLTPEYSSLSKDIRDWEPADSTAVALYSLNDLSNNASSEILLGQVGQKAAAIAAIGGAKLAVAKALQDLYLDFRPTFDAYTVPAANTAIALLDKAKKGKSGGRRPSPARGPAAPPSQDVQALLAAANQKLATLPGAAAKSRDADVGSNNWVIAGSRATGGRPLLANDPHLSLTNPSIWFPVEIDGKTGGTGKYHAAGGSFPGLPSIQTGHNESIAWGVTVAYWDLSDVYLETLTGPNTVSFNSGDVAIVKKDIDFIDQGKKVTKGLAWVPHHGPIVSVDLAKGTAVTIRWRGHDGSTDAQALLQLGLAGSIAEAKTALGFVTTANQNFIIADKSGKIGYFPFAKVPVRTWAGNVPGDNSPFFPLTGNGTREWGGDVAVADIPQVQDPAAGFIATANGDITGASQSGFPIPSPAGNAPIQTVSRAEGTRIQRVIESIKATGAANTIETMRVLQGDTKSLIAQTIVPRLTAAAAATPEGGFVPDAPATVAMVGALNAYQTGATYTCPTGLDGLSAYDSPKTADATIARESVGCAAFHTALYALFVEAFDDEVNSTDAGTTALGAAPTNNMIPVLMRSLRSDTYNPASETFWLKNGVGTRTEVLQRALTKAGAVLATNYGAAADGWRWGKMHTVTLKSPLSAPSIQLFDSATYATQGGLYTVNVANPAAVNLNDNSPAGRLRFAHTTGPSIRTLIEVGTDTPHMKISLPGGADLHRDSAFYNNLVPRWASNTPVDFAFGAGAVKTPAVDLQVKP